MAYIIPVIINNRRVHYFKLKKRTPAGNTQTPEPFIVCMDKADNRLFHFDRSMAAKVIGDTKKRDIKLHSGIVTFQFDSNSQNKEIAINIKKGVGEGSHADTYNDVEKDDSPYNESWEDDEEDCDDDSDTVSDAPTSIGKINNVLFLQKEYDQCLAIDASIESADEQFKTHFEITCSITIEENNATYFSSFKLHLVGPLQLLQGALDFGSEASQMLQQQKKDRGGISHDVITHFNILESLLPASEIANADKYVQYESGTSFYRSVFYIRKLMKVDDDFYKDDKATKGYYFLPEEDNNLKMTVKATEENSAALSDFIQLPNIKLMRRYHSQTNSINVLIDHEGSVDRCDIDTLMRKTYGSILKKIIAAWLQKIKNGPQYVRLTLLVPNIYDEGDVRQSLETLHAIFSSLQEDSNMKKKFCGWEVQTVSESDAAFLGYYIKQAIPPPPDNNYYVIIDCGKGTTDFSLIKAGKTPAEPLLPIYRNGIAGAGNMISYAVFQSIIKYISEVGNDKKHTARFVKTIIESKTDFLRRLASLVDQLKHTHRANADQRDINGKWNNIQEGNFDFANLAEKQDYAQLNALLARVIDQRINTVPDANNLIEKTCGMLVKAITSSIQTVTSALQDKGMRCAGVFLTGRGFLFLPLKTMLQNELVDILKIHKDLIKEPTEPNENEKGIREIDMAEYKSISLEGVLNSPFLMQPQIIGWPVQVEHVGKQAQTDEQQTTRTITVKDLLFIKRIEEITKWFKLKIPGRVASIDALNKLEGSFDTHRLLIGNHMHWPDDVQFRQALRDRRYDLVFDPEGLRNGFSVRRIFNGRCEETHELDKKSPINRGIEKFVKPSLFPLDFDRDDMTALVED